MKFPRQRQVTITMTSTAAALKKNGLEAELLDMDEPEKLAHAFAAMLPETAAAQRANAAMADFLQAHI